MEIMIEPVTEADFAAWRMLYDGYADFYRMPMDDAIAGRLWTWLLDPAHEMEGLVARTGDGVVGLAHFRRMPSPLRGADIGFLDDLFVAPEARGRQVGEALLGRLGAIARERGWSKVRWLTADDNYRARALYDRVGRKTIWNTYEMEIA